MSLTRIPSSLVANTFTSNTVLFANGLGYLSNTSNFQYFSGNNTISVGSVVAGGVDVINFTQAAYNAANAAGSSAYVQSAYDQANTATGIAQAAFNSANNVAPQVQPAFDKANIAYTLAQSSYDSSNLVNQFAQSAYNAANAAGSSAYVQSAFDKANSANSLAQAAYNAANTALAGNTISWLTVNKHTYTATAGQTTFNIDYTPGLITLVINGSTIDSSEYTATNGTTIVLNNAASLNDIVDITGFVSANTISSAFTGPQGNTGPAGPEFTGNTSYQLVTTNTQTSTSTSTGALVVYGGAGIAGNVYSNKIYTDGIFYSANGLPFQMGSPDLTDNWAREQANTNANTIIAVNQYAQSAHYHANLNETTIIQVNDFARWVSSVANVAAANTITIQGVDIKQNADILYATAIAGYGWDTGNTAISIASDAQQRLNVHAGINNTQNTRIDGIEGANITQNTNITSVNQYAASAYDKANNALPLAGGTVTGTILVGQDVYVSGNLYVSGNTTTVGANNITLNDSLIYLADENPANTVDIGIVGHFVQGKYQHTGVVRNHLNGNWTFFSNVSTEPTTTINFAEANLVYDSITTGGIITPSATINGKDWQSVNDTQNTNITYVNQFAQAAFDSANNVAPQVQPAFNTANSASANTIIIQGVDTTQNTRLDGVEGVNITQNTNITYVNQFAQSGYNTANGANGLAAGAFNKANNALANTTGTFAGDLTTTGNVKVNSTQAATSTTTGALTVSGGVGITGNLYAGNIYTNGALINNSAALTVYKYVASAGQTTFSGLDSNGLTLAYTASAIFVTLNGVVLNNTLEYTATNGTSVVLGTAAELDDELNIYAFGAFQIADAYTSAQADSKFLTQANGALINQFAQSSYDTANGANGLAAGAYNTANGANGLASGAFNKANNAVAQSGGTITGSLSISQDLTVTGNLSVLGNSTTITTNTLDVGDSLIYLANNNLSTDTVDIGIIGHYDDGTDAHTGIFRDPNLKEWIFFKGYTPEVQSNNLINIAHPSFAYANVYASYFKGNVISQGYDLFNYSSAAFSKANTAYTTALNGSNSNVQFYSVGVGTAASGTYGEIRAINNITGYYSSDRQYKENIINIPDALNKVESIGGKMFDWTDSYIQEHGGADGYFVQKRDFGVIAQDVQAVFPEAVRTREDGSLAVDYSKLSALAFAAIVELKKEIEELKNNK